MRPIRSSLTFILSAAAGALAAAALIAPIPCLADDAQSQAQLQPQAVSLATLMEAARAYHPTPTKSPLVAEALALQRARIHRAYWPQLVLSGQASLQSEVTHLDLPLPGVAPVLPAKDQYKATLELTQAIWDGGVAASQQHVAQARARLEQAKVNVEWEQVRDGLLQVYFGAIVQQELASQAALLERSLDTVVAKAEVALKQGLTTERDVLQVQARRLEARQARGDAEAALAAARQSLEALSGLTLAPETVLPIPPDSCQGAVGEAPVGISDEAIHRPELASLAAQGAVLAAQDSLERAADRPRLAAFATAGYGRPGLNFLDDSFDFYYLGGARLTVPLTYLYAGTRHNGRAQLAVQQALLRHQRDAFLLQTKVQLAKQRLEVARLRGAAVLDEELVDVRARSRKQTELQVALGTSTVTDLVNDLSLEDQARTKQAVHRAQAGLACQQLALIKGDL